MTAPQWPISPTAKGNDSTEEAGYRYGHRDGVRDAIAAFVQWQNQQPAPTAVEGLGGELIVLGARVAALETLVIEANRRSKKALKRARWAAETAEETFSKVEDTKLPEMVTDDEHPDFADFPQSPRPAVIAQCGAMQWFKWSDDAPRVRCMKQIMHPGQHEAWNSDDSQRWGW